MSKRKTLYLVDGYALIYRAFFAMIGRPLTTSSGENTSAAWGVANFLLRLLEEMRPDYVAWVHDAGSSFRKEVFPEYKATREKLDEELQEQFDQSVARIEDLLEAFDVELVAAEGYEADDVIGTLADRATQTGLDVIIVSGDKDFYQLIDDGVSLLNPGRGGPAAVEEQLVTVDNAADRLGVPPEYVPDYLALVGDSSDNVPGVKGIGPKTAQKLIAEFGALESILERVEGVKGKRAREALLREPDNARLSKKLVTIDREIPLDLDIDDLKTGSPDGQTLLELFSDLEFSSLLPKVSELTGVENVGTPPQNETEATIPDLGDLTELAATIRRAKACALSVELTRGMPLERHIVGLALATPDRSWYLPLGHSDYDNLPPLADEGMAPVKGLLEDESTAKWGHGVKSGWLALRSAGVELGGVEYDLEVASFLVGPGRRSHDLKILAADVLGRDVRSRADLTGTGKSRLKFEDVPVKNVAAYSAGRLSALVQLKESFADQLTDLSTSGLFYDIEMPLVKVLADMEWTGVRIDLGELEKLSRDFGEELDEIEKKIHKEAGTDFNINSTPQLRHILFEKLQLPVVKKTKTGPSTDADVLEQLARSGFTLPELLLKYREITKLKSTYIDSLPNSVNQDTGRIHTTFNQIGATTGRLSSYNPNLQNIPVRTERGGSIRKCFVPSEGGRLVVADYSQIELRLLAHLSQDELLIEAFKSGGDVHRETAAAVFEVEVDEVTSDMRERAKTINFATIYGQGPFALSQQLDISRKEAQDFIDRYFERFAGVRSYLDSQVDIAKRRGFVETIFGRRRFIPELKDPKHQVRAFGERTAMNSPLQGSAADLIKVAMVRLARSLHDGGLQGRMVLQVHDELVLDAPADEAEKVAELAREQMEGAAQLSVSLVVDIGIGQNWLDAKSRS